MKKIILIICLNFGFTCFSQEHFGGISTSSRVGILNTTLNPAEFANLSKKIEVNIYGLSFNVSNNIIGFSDLSSDKNFEDLIFQGNEPVNMRIDVEMIGPSAGVSWKKWGFGLTTKGNGKFDLVDIDPNLGKAVTDNIDNILNTSSIQNNKNQRMIGTTWGELGLSAARTLFENDKNRFSAGVTFKLLFPGSYTNFGLDKFNGTINTAGGESYLNNTQANLNFAYSGNLSDSFTNFDDYSKSIFGGLNGLATDIGVNYQRKDGDKKYKLNIGLALKNMGSMTFKNDSNSSTSYSLNIPSTVVGINLNQFSGSNSLKDIEKVLQDSGYLTTIVTNKDFKVKLPTVLNLYADVKIIPKLFVTLFTQQKLNDNNSNDQITTQNIISITPRVNLGFFEAYSSWLNSEISGLNGGIGFRLGGFYIGSSSVVTALINDSKQADFYTGFRWAFL